MIIGALSKRFLDIALTAGLKTVRVNCLANAYGKPRVPDAAADPREKICTAPSMSIADEK